MGTNQPSPSSPQGQQPLDCQECGARKEHESRELMNTAAKKESEETGFRWLNTISTKVHGLFGLNVEQEISQKDIETTSQTNTGRVQRDFNICPNLSCEQHLEDRWGIRLWELTADPNLNSSNVNMDRERMQLENEVEHYREVTTGKKKPSLDPSDFQSSDETSEQPNDTNADDTSTDSLSDKQTDKSTGFRDRVRNWWADNRVREWVSRGSDDSTDTNTAPADSQSTENQSKQTTNEQTSLWEYSADTQVELSEGTVGQQSNNDIDTGAGMSSSTSESEDFDNDRSNSI
jgi:hypothetical protein